MTTKQDEWQCPNCLGMCETRGPERGMPYYPCRYCDGEGVVPEAKASDWHMRNRDELERLREELAEAYWLIAQVGQVEEVNHYVPDYARSLAVFRRAREGVDKEQPA